MPKRMGLSGRKELTFHRFMLCVLAVFTGVCPTASLQLSLHCAKEMACILRLFAGLSSIIFKIKESLKDNIFIAQPGAESPWSHGVTLIIFHGQYDYGYAHRKITDKREVISQLT